MSAAIASNPPQPTLDSTLHRGGGLRRSSTLKRLSQWVWSGWAATPSIISTTTTTTRSHDSQTAISRSETVGLLRDMDGIALSHNDNITSDSGRHIDATTTNSDTRVTNGVVVSHAVTDTTTSEQQDSLQPLLRASQHPEEQQDDSRMPTPCLTCRDWTRCDRIYPRCGHCRYEQVMCFYTSKSTTHNNKNNSNTLRRSGTTVKRSESTTTTTVRRKKRHSSVHQGLGVQAEL